MSTLKIEERFTLEAEPGRVFEFLCRPERIVGCLPGASLDEVREDGTYAGTVKVKLGSASLSYRGTMVFLEVDEENLRVRMEGKGREKAGGGAVRMTMESQVVASGSGSEVTVDADVQLAGKIVRFARGMIQGVSAEIFRQFTECLGEVILADGGGVPSGGEEEGDRSKGEKTRSEGPTPAGAQDGLNLFAILWQAFRSWVRRLLGRD